MGKTLKSQPKMLLKGILAIMESLRKQKNEKILIRVDGRLVCGLLKFSLYGFYCSKKLENVTKLMGFFIRKKFFDTMLN